MPDWQNQSKITGVGLLELKKCSRKTREGNIILIYNQFYNFWTDRHLAICGQVIIIYSIIYSRHQKVMTFCAQKSIVDTKKF